MQKIVARSHEKFLDPPDYIIKRVKKGHGYGQESNLKFTLVLLCSFNAAYLAFLHAV